MTTFREQVRAAIAAIAESPWSWVITTKGRALLRRCYRAGCEGQALALHLRLNLPVLLAYQIGQHERRKVQ